MKILILHPIIFDSGSDRPHLDQPRLLVMKNDGPS